MKQLFPNHIIHNVLAIVLLTLGLTQSTTSLAVVTPPCAPAPSGLVSWWPGELNANDVIGTNNGIVLSNANFATGEVGNAFNFNASGARVRVPASSSLNVGAGNGFTIETWINPADVSVGHPIVEWNSGSYGVCLWISTWGGDARAGALYADIKDTSLTDHPFISAGNLIATNVFQHVALTYNKTTGIAAIYLNGVALVQTNLGSFTPFTYSDMYFGYRIADGGAGSRFIGQIDEVSLYNRALSAAEIQGVYNAQSAGKCRTAACVSAPTGLVSWWRGEGNLSDSVDSNNGSALGGLSFGLGLVGQAFSFNGTNAGVFVPASSNLNVGTGGGLTIETWINPTNVNPESPIAEWNNISGVNPIGAHFWMSIRPPNGGDVGSLFANLVDTSGNFHILKTAAGILASNTFQHVALTYDKSSGQATIYLNGQVVAQQNLGIFTPQTTYNLYLGFRPAGFALSYWWPGLMDEVSLYNRALSQSEIQAIYNAASSGKCALTTPPSIVSQPANRTVTVGANATFTVTAAGAPPLSYQWLLNGTTAIAGATGTSLTLTNVQLSQSGNNYSVRVTNAFGSVTSSNALLTVLPLPPCITAPTGLVSWWRGEGNTLDEVGANHGTLVGNTSYGSGRVGQSFVFDGSGDLVSVGNPASLQLQNLTIEAWVKRSSSSTVSFGAGGNGIIFGYGGGGYSLYMESNGRLAFTQLGLTTVFSSATITDTNFHHVAATKSGSTVFFYIDGVTNSAPAFNATFSFSSVAAIGGRGDNLDNSFFGNIDDVAVYSRALFASEIQAIFNAGSAGKCTQTPPTNCVPAPSGLVSLWPAESNALDSADGNNGTLAGNTTFGAGRVGQGFVFDGNGDSVQVGNPANLQLQDLSIEAWIKRNSASSITLSAGGGGFLFGYSIGGYVAYMGLDSRIYFGKAGTVAFPGTSTISDTNFHHIAITKSGNTVRYYLDGAADGTSSLAEVFSFTTIVGIGGESTNSGSSFLGTIDELGVYNRALSTNEIAAIYNAGSAGKCPTTPPPNCTPAASGLVSWWRAEGAAADESGGNNGTLVGDTAFGTGRVGQAFVFDGNGDRVSVGSPTNLMLQNLTIEGWIKRASPTVASFNGNGLGMIFAWGIGGYGLYIEPGGRPALSKVGINNVTLTSASISDTNFHHLAVTKSGSTVVFYIDGVAYAAPSSYDPGFTFSSGARIGAWDNPDVNSFFGSIDELAIYNRGLSAVEVQAIYNAGSFGKCFTPVGPVILTQPASQTVTVGSSATFTVVASGTSPLSYQWRFNGTNIAGATGSALALINVQVNDAGNYSVRVSNAVNSVTSSNALLTVNPAPPCAVPPPGLVSWWKGEGNALDQADGNNGTLAGNTAFGAGRVGQGFVLDGNADAVQVGNPANLQLQNLTIEAWVKRASASAISQNGGLGMIFAYGSGGYGLYLDSAGHPALSRIDVNNVTLGSAAITDTSFHHLAVTKSGSTVVFYIDGVAYTAPAYSPGFTFTTAAAIGSWSSTFNDTFYGTIDEVAIYNRALSAAEVQSVYNAGSAGKCTAPQAPVILVQPTNRTAFVGQNVSFNVLASGTPPLSYQWRKNGSPIGGATTPTYTINNVQTNEAGTYSVLVTNVVGPALSSNAVLTVTPLVCAPLPSGVISWWPAQLSGQDVAGTNNATLLNGATYGVGEVGQGFSLDGVDDRITVADSPSLNFGSTGDFSIEAWIKAFPTNTSFNVMSIVEKRRTLGTGGAAIGYAFYLDAGRLSCQLDPAPGSGYNSFNSPGPNLQDGVFHHVAVSVHRNSSGGGRLYVDGQLVHTFDTTIGAGDITTTEPLRIGNHPDLSLNSFFKGTIDETAIYNRALSAAEILAIYNASSLGKCRDLPSNRAPVANPQSVSVNEDTARAITLTGSDPDGNPLTYIVISGPTNGTLSGAAPNLTYRPNTNYFGADAFTFKVNDGQLDSAPALVAIEIHPVNDAPVARIGVSPLANFPGVTNLVVIAADCSTNAEVVLDGSGSSDVENDPLTFMWFDSTNVIAGTTITTNALSTGTHEITLVVDDGSATGSQSVTVDVISLSESVGVVIALLEDSTLPRRNTRPLTVSLKTAAASLEQCNLAAGANQLEAFQNKVRAQVATFDPALADDLIAAAQVIIDVLNAH